MKSLRGILLLGFCVLMATSAQAVTVAGTDITWNGSAGDGLWSNSDNWDPVGIPQSGDNIHITGGLGETIQYDYEYPEGTQFNSLEIDNNNELSMNSGYNLETLTTQVIGDLGSGALTQSAGTNLVGTDLTIGGSEIGNGTYDLQGGGLVVNNAMNVGSWGNGLVTQAAGATADIFYLLILGNANTGTGEYDLSGDLTMHGNEYIGLAGTGYFYQNMGVHQVDNFLTLGTYSGSYGEYNLINGTLTVGNEFIGQDGNAVFSQNDGAHNVTQDLRIGGGTSSISTYNLINGDLVTGSDLSVGFYGTGIFNQLGGKNTVSEWLLVGDYSTGVGTYSLQAGELQANYEHIGYEGEGTFLQTGGENTVTNDLTFGDYSSGTGSGQYILNDPTGTVASSLLVKQNIKVGNAGVGLFEQLSGNVDVGGLRVGSLGTYNLYDGNLLNTRATVFTTAFDGIASDPSAVVQELNNAGRLQLVRTGSVSSEDMWRIVGSNPELAQALFGLYPDRGAVTGTSFDAIVGSDNTTALLAALQAQNYINGSGEITDAFRALGNDVSSFSLPGYEAQAGSIFAVLYKAAEWTNVVAVIEQTSRGEVVDGVFNQFGGDHNVSGGLTVGETGTGTYNQYDDNLTAQGEIIGDAGTGYFSQTGGKNTTVWGMNIGQQQNSIGSYTLQQGDLTVGSSELVGASGNGTFIQQGGNNNVLDILIVGASSTGQGEYDLQDGNLTTVWEVVGQDGTGRFVQDAGENNIQEALTVGANGVGTYEQNGGAVNVGTALLVGNNKGGTGTYNLHDGNLSVNLNHTWTETFIGGDGTGTFNQEGGVFDASPGAMYLGNTAGSMGIYNMTYRPLEQSQFEVSGMMEFLGQVTSDPNQGYADLIQLLIDNGYVQPDGMVDSSFSGLSDEFKQAFKDMFNYTDADADARYATVFYHLEDVLFHPLSGSLLAGGLALGEWGGTGIFNQYAGSVQTGSLELARQPDSYGEYNLGPFGHLQVNGFEGVGNLGEGVFNQYGVSADHQIGGDLVLGGFYRYLPERALVTPDQFPGIDFSALVDALVARGDMTVTPDGKYQVNGQFVGISVEYAAQFGLSLSPEQAADISDTLNSAVFSAIITGNGTFNLQAGNLMVSGNERIGMVGVGQFLQSGGTHYVAGSMSLGGRVDVPTYTEEIGGQTFPLVTRAQIGVGVYNMTAPDANLQVDGVIRVGEGGIGIFNQTAGQVVASGLELGTQLYGSGNYELGDTFGNGSTSPFLYVTGFESIGGLGTGTFTQYAGSSHVVDQDLVIANGAQWIYGQVMRGAGSYNLNAGDLYVGGNEIIGQVGTGTFTQTDGTNIVLVDLHLGGGGSVQIAGQETPEDPFDDVSLAITGDGTYNMNGGDLNVAGTIFDAYAGTGNFLQTGGQVNTGVLQIGFLGGSNGTYTMDSLDGLAGLNVNYDAVVGNDGDGTFSQSGGQVNIAQTLLIGNGASANGYYTMQSDGKLDVTGNIAVGQSGYGLFQQNAGSVGANAVCVGCLEGGRGVYNLDSYNGLASLTANYETIGGAGEGMFFQKHGSMNTVNGDFRLGEMSTGNGYYEMNDNSSLGIGGFMHVGEAGTGAFTQNSGTVTVGQDLTIAEQPNSVGAYYLGNYDETTALNVTGFEDIGSLGQGAFVQRGDDSLNTVGMDLNIGNGGFWDADSGEVVSGTGSYDLYSGTLEVGRFENIGVAGYGSFNQSGGTHTISGYLELGGPGVQTAGQDTPDDATDDVFQVGTGEYQLSFNGELNVGGTIYDGAMGIGDFMQSGGTVNADKLLVGVMQGSSGSYRLDSYFGAASLTVNNESIGYSGTGAFSQNYGSQHTVNGNLIMGKNVTGVGTYDLMIGTLDVGGAMRVGDAGVGTFNQYGGDVAVHAKDGEGLTIQAQPREAPLSGQSVYNMSGGTLTVGQVVRDGGGKEVSFTPASIVNNGLFNIHDGGTALQPIMVRGNITNNSEFAVSNATVKFDGTFQNNGAFHSDPSTMSFTDLYIGSDGYLTGVAGDAYKIAGSFQTQSTQNLLWETRNAQLIFEAAQSPEQQLLKQSHQLLFNSVDSGAVLMAYNNNFAWGTVDFGGEESGADFLVGSLALYTGSLLGIDLEKDADTGKLIAANLSGDSNVYYIYDPANPGANDYLKGQIYAFASGKGQVIPVVTPEPAAFLLYGMGGLPLVSRFMRRRKNMVKG